MSLSRTAVLFLLMLLPVQSLYAEDLCRNLQGLIEPSERVELSSQVPGVLAEVLVDRGDPVRAGQVVAKLNSKVEEAMIDLSKAKLEFGRRKAVRNEELFKEKLISEHEKDEMETEIRLAALELRDAEERRNLRDVVSPIDGIVMERLLSPGEYTSQEAIMQIVAIDPLYVEVVAPVECYGKIRQGGKARVLPGEPVGGSYLSTVAIADKVIDAASGTFGVRLVLPNSEGKLPAGLGCRVKFLD
ncbi:MAG: efflux RND transporter periplasmic adaptor subunit [Desulfurivibrionaceae bacterium]|nr:efflux RND transporter periplasmic adaptor subunit [Desulfurivibrionaceae bacterium]